MKRVFLSVGYILVVFLGPMTLVHAGEEVVAEADLSAGLVGYWKFDAPADLGLDSSDFENNGAVTSGDVTYTEEGIINGAAKFVEGTINNAIKVPHSVSLDLTEEITMATWIKLDGINTDNGDAIFSKDGATQPYAFFAGLEDVFGSAMGVWFSGVPINSDSVIPKTEWTHLATTYDENTVKFYINGKFLIEKASSVGLREDVTADLNIGASPFGAPEDFSGLMDEARIYNRVLSESEILKLFNETQVVEVAIDIKPGNKQNVINLRARGRVWVAVLSDSEFDPSQIEIPTVRFGTDEARVIRHRVSDVNGDGLGDLSLCFKIPQTGIACGDTEALLTGATFDSELIEGFDSIRTVGCR